MADLLEEIIGKPLGRVHLPAPPDDPRTRRPDLTRAKTVLGWSPTVSLRDGLALTLVNMPGCADH